MLILQHVPEPSGIGSMFVSISGSRQQTMDSNFDVICTGRNPFDGYTPSVPSGVKLDYGGPECLSMEAVGLKAAGSSAFVLVAGGLGERLGYSGTCGLLPMLFRPYNCCCI